MPSGDLKRKKEHLKLENKNLEPFNEGFQRTKIHLLCKKREVEAGAIFKTESRVELYTTESRGQKKEMAPSAMICL